MLTESYKKYGCFFAFYIFCIYFCKFLAVILLFYLCFFSNSLKESLNNRAGALISEPKLPFLQSCWSFKIRYITLLMCASLKQITNNVFIFILPFHLKVTFLSFLYNTMKSYFISGIYTKFMCWITFFIYPWHKSGQKPYFSEKFNL